MKKILALLLCLSLSACCACGFQNDPYTIELITKSNLKVDFWESVYQGATAAADVYGITLNLRMPNSEDDYEQQIELLEQAAARKPDAIILAANDYTLLAQPVQDVIHQGVPVVMIDSDVDNQNTVAYVGTDNVEIGALLAEKLYQNIETAGSVGVVSFVKDSQTALAREKGFRETLARYDVEGRYPLLDTVYCDSEVDLSKVYTIQMLNDNPGLTAIAALNDPSVEGVCAALEEFPERDVQVFAIDCTPKQIPYMENGTITYSILQNPYQMGYYAVETGYKYLKGEMKQHDIYTDIYPVDLSMVFDDMYQQLIFPFE